MAKHTKAPWILHALKDGGREITAKTAGGPLIAQVAGWEHSKHKDEAEANANLMVASPMLLAAAEMVQRIQNKGIEQTTGAEWDDLKTAVDDAIAAAKGEVPHE